MVKGKHTGLLYHCLLLIKGLDSLKLSWGSLWRRSFMWHKDLRPKR